jgi:hypothetical protein
MSIVFRLGFNIPNSSIEREPSNYVLISFFFSLSLFLLLVQFKSLIFSKLLYFVLSIVLQVLQVF